MGLRQELGALRGGETGLRTAPERGDRVASSLLRAEVSLPPQGRCPGSGSPRHSRSLRHVVGSAAVSSRGGLTGAPWRSATCSQCRELSSGMSSRPHPGTPWAALDESQALPRPGGGPSSPPTHTPRLPQQLGARAKVKHKHVGGEQT